MLVLLPASLSFLFLSSQFIQKTKKSSLMLYISYEQWIRILFCFALISLDMYDDVVIMFK